MERILIADDEQLARERLLRLTTKHAPASEIRLAVSGRDAIEQIREFAPTLVLLDVQMPEGTGFDVIRTIGTDAMPPVIFVTAYDQYAIGAFDSHAIDYLLKPFGEDRFIAALNRAEQWSQFGGSQIDNLRQLLEQHAARPRHPERLVVKAGDRIIVIRTIEIECIEAASNYVRIHVGKTSHLVRQQLGQLEELLDPERFVRIHRSMIVNLDRIRMIQPAVSGDQTAILDSGRQVRVSRTFRDSLYSRMGGVPPDAAE